MQKRFNKRSKIAKIVTATKAFFFASSTHSKDTNPNQEKDTFYKRMATRIVTPPSKEELADRKEAAKAEAKKSAHNTKTLGPKRKIKEMERFRIQM